MFLIFYRPENLYKKDKMKIYKIQLFTFLNLKQKHHNNDQTYVLENFLKI